MTKSVLVAAMTAAICLFVSCGPRKLSFTWAEIKCREVLGAKTAPSEAPSIIVEGYVRSTDIEQHVADYGDTMQLEIFEQPGEHARIAPIILTKGSQRNQAEVTVSGGKISGLRIHTDDGGTAGPGDKISVEVKLTPAPASKICHLNATNITKL